MDFHISGDAAAIRSRAATMRTKGESFSTVGASLSKITTGSWTGRAAEHFKDDFDIEPKRWSDAGAGFATAASALEGFADAVENAKNRAAWCTTEYERGTNVSTQARHDYDADVSQAKAEVSSARAQGSTMTLTILPFADPGQKIRDGAVAEFESAKNDLETAAQDAARGVRNGCATAPDKRKWYESGLAAIGGFFAGAGEAVWDLVTMPGSPVNQLIDSIDLASGQMTPEELATKHQLGIEQVGAMLEALKDDPLEFGKNLGKAVLDWDTWADDPARALGHLVPDAIAAVFTAGAGAAATRGAKAGADVMDSVGDLSKVDDVGDLSKLDDMGEIGKLDDVGGLSHVDLEDLPDWADGKDLPASGPGSELYPDDMPRFGDRSRQEFFDTYWDRDNGSWNYPTERDGFPDGFDGPIISNNAGTNEVIDRFGRPDGDYASPAGTPFEDRALPPSSIGSDYHQYRVLRPLPDTVTEGKIAAWFEQPGGGVQYKFDHPISWYVEHDYLESVS